MSMGVPCRSDMHVAMGSAVYGTPHMTSKPMLDTWCHMTSATCTSTTVAHYQDRKALWERNLLDHILAGAIRLMACIC